MVLSDFSWRASQPSMKSVKPGDRDQRDSIPRLRDEHESEREHDTRQRNRIGKSEQRAAIHATEKYDRV